MVRRRFEFLLDVTSTYFEGQTARNPSAQRGYSIRSAQRQQQVGQSRVPERAQGPSSDGHAEELAARAVRRRSRSCGAVDRHVRVPGAGLTYQLYRDKLRIVRRRQGRYLLRTNLTNYDPDALWRYHMQRVFVKEAFRTLKGDLAILSV